MNNATVNISAFVPDTHVVGISVVNLPRSRTDGHSKFDTGEPSPKHLIQSENVMALQKLSNLVKH